MAQLPFAGVWRKPPSTPRVLVVFTLTIRRSRELDVGQRATPTRSPCLRITEAKSALRARAPSQSESRQLCHHHVQFMCPYVQFVWDRYAVSRSGRHHDGTPG